jgi:hypothetical protein
MYTCMHICILSRQSRTFERPFIWMAFAYMYTCMHICILSRHTCAYSFMRASVWLFLVFFWFIYTHGCYMANDEGNIRYNYRLRIYLYIHIHKYVHIICTYIIHIYIVHMYICIYIYIILVYIMYIYT